MSYLDDPRVFFAAERTLLAWVRTGIASIGLGFVVAKFGIFIQFIAQAHGTPARNAFHAEVIGALLIVVGSAACWLAGLQFRRFSATLCGKEVPKRHLVTLPWWFANCFAVLGLLLAVHLLL